MPDPSRKEVWFADLDPTRGHEQFGKRPVLIVSTNTFNQGPADLVIVVSLTTRARRVQSHVRIEPPEGGLKTTSYAMCEAVRSISKERLIDRWGVVADTTMGKVADYLRILLEL
jgi:mRNA interferase MazF